MIEKVLFDIGDEIIFHNQIAFVTMITLSKNKGISYRLKFPQSKYPMNQGDYTQEELENGYARKIGE